MDLIVLLTAILRKRKDIPCPLFSVLPRPDNMGMGVQLCSETSISRYFKYVTEISQHECQLKPHLLSIGSQCLSPSAIISDCYGCRMDCKMRVERRRDITAGTVWREGGIRNTKIYCFQSNCVSSPNQMGILPSSLNCLERRRIFKVLSAEKQFSFMRMFHYIFIHISDFFTIPIICRSI